MVAYILEKKTTFETILAKGEAQGILPDLDSKSKQWFRKTAETTTANPSKLLADDKTRMQLRPQLGKMYVFQYDAKHKKTLPYYDRFPLVIPFDAIRTNGYASNGAGFMGLNLHYLHPWLRARLMDGLYAYISDDKLDENTRLKMNYKLLKRVSQLRFFAPCVKQYLFAHMRSRFFFIHPKEWDIALFLNLARWQGSSQANVWKDSNDKIF